MLFLSKTTCLDQMMEWGRDKGPTGSKGSLELNERKARKNRQNRCGYLRPTEWGSDRDVWLKGDFARQLEIYLEQYAQRGGGKEHRKS